MFFCFILKRVKPLLREQLVPANKIDHYRFGAPGVVGGIDVVKESPEFSIHARCC